MRVGRPGARTRSATSAGGGIGEWLAGQIEQQTGKEARTTVLGHIQRGGTPTAFDRVLATRFGLHAIDAVHDGDWGKMVALRGTDIVRVPLADATDRAEDRLSRSSTPRPRCSSADVICLRRPGRDDLV